MLQFRNVIVAFVASVTALAVGARAEDRSANTVSFAKAVPKVAASELVTVPPQNRPIAEIRTAIRAQIEALEALERRLIAAVLAGAKPKATPLRPGPGLIGQTSISGKDVGLLLRYEHGRILRHDDLARAITARLDAKLPDRGTQVAFTGWLLVPRDMKVKLWFAGGSSNGGVHTLRIGGQEIATIGDDRKKSLVRDLQLPEGIHRVRWVLNGGDFGANLLRFQDPETEAQLPIFFTHQDIHDLPAVPDTQIVRVTSTQRGWPIPNGW